MRHRIDVQQQNLVSNNRGGRRTPEGQNPWVTVMTSISAEVLPLRGGEALEHAVLRSKQLWRIAIRPRAGITTAMRVVWQDRIMGEISANIRSAALSADGSELVMTAESGVAG